MAGPEPEYLIVGSVQKPHGIKGELMVRLETDRPGVVFAPGRELLLGDAEGRPSGGTLTVERARPFKGGMLVKVPQHGGRTPEVEALRGRTLLIPREQAAPLDDDEVFYHQVIGLKVMADGVQVGVVQELYDDAPSGPLLSVRREGKKELLIPFVKGMVRRLDAAQGVLELEAPAGLLDL
ncbi:MAG TPA: ribosome maturation factor RimM [Longimicrobium sp.]|nr:ribosome maturation factor RimM [Longimicrobium sp.]